MRMKKIITLIVLLTGMACTASAWYDDMYLVSNINLTNEGKWDFEHITSNAGYTNRFTLSGDNFSLTLDRATILKSGGTDLYFIIRYRASDDTNKQDFRPKSNSDYEFTDYSAYTFYDNSNYETAFKVALAPNTAKVHINVKCYNDNGTDKYDITVAQLMEYTITWDNNLNNWGAVYAYTYDQNLGSHPNIQWLGTFPGTSAEVLDADKKLYKITFYGTLTVKAIFNQGNNSSQTTNLNTVNYGVYVNTSNSDPTGVIATISDAGIGTFCSSKDVTIPEGVTASYITGIGDKNVLATTNFTDGIPANTGALIQGDAGTYTFPIADTSPTAASENKLVCCLNTTAVSQTDGGGNNNYILTKKTVNGTVATPMFFLVNSAGNTVTGGHAYLQLSDPAIAREYFFLWDETESIDNPQLTSDDSQMVYDLQGRRVQQPVKGLYIVDGKKVIK